MDFKNGLTVVIAIFAVLNLLNIYLAVRDKKPYSEISKETLYLALFAALLYERLS